MASCETRLLRTPCIGKGSGGVLENTKRDGERGREPIAFYTSLTYSSDMVFIETPIFTKLVKELLSDEEYRSLQEALLLRPETGDVIPGGGGLRKIRWRMSGKGKRGGCQGHLLLGHTR